MKANIFISIIVLFISTSFFASAETNNIICNECNSEYDFENIAYSQGYGTSIIINPDSGQAFSWRKIKDPEGDIIIPKLVPTAVYDAIYKYQSLKQSFTELSSIQSNSSVNGCGASNDWKSEFIPDMPFESACNNHDSGQ